MWHIQYETHLIRWPIGHHWPWPSLASLNPCGLHALLSVFLPFKVHLTINGGNVIFYSCKSEYKYLTSILHLLSQLSLSLLQMNNTWTGSLSSNMNAEHVPQRIHHLYFTAFMWYCLKHLRCHTNGLYGGHNYFDNCHR